MMYIKKAELRINYNKNKRIRYGEYMSYVINILKMLAGIVISVIGVVWYTGPSMMGFFGYWEDLLTLLKGTVGLFLLSVGLIVIWMGYDDYKMDIELEKFEKLKLKISKLLS